MSEIWVASKSSYFMHASKEITPALVATDWKDPQIVAIMTEPEDVSDDFACNLKTLMNRKGEKCTNR